MKTPQQSLLVAPDPSSPRVVRVKLTVPYPPSVNEIYRHTAKFGRVVKYKTTEHREYVGAVGNAVRRAQLHDPLIDTFPFTGPVALTIRIYRPAKRGDLDNRIKAIQDALNQVAWLDDAQIVAIHAYRFDDKANPRADLEIEGEVP